MKTTPWWLTLLATQGLAVLIVLWGMGLIPGTTSPLVRLEALASSMNQHEETSREAIRVNRLVCRGVWQSTPAVQAECNR